MPRNDRNVLMEDVRIIFRNFAGKEGTYNREGDRNFAVLLDDDTAKRMERDGWTIKYLKPREDDEEQHEQAYLPVAVNFKKGRPPKVVMISSGGRNTLGEDEVEILDDVDIANVDLIVNPYDWAVNGKSGTKAYLDSIYITIEENYLDRKYREIDESRRDN